MAEVSKYRDGITRLGLAIGIRQDVIDGWISTWSAHVPRSMRPEAWVWACDVVARDYQPGSPYPTVRQVLDVAGRYESHQTCQEAVSRHRGCSACNAPAFDSRHPGAGFPGRVACIRVRVTVEYDDGDVESVYYLSAEDRGLDALPELSGRVKDWAVDVASCLCNCEVGRAIAAAIQARNADPDRTGGSVPVERGHVELTGYVPPDGSHWMAAGAVHRIRREAVDRWGPRACTMAMEERRKAWRGGAR